jgi:hypothetical protein
MVKWIDGERATGRDLPNPPSVGCAVCSGSEISSESNEAWNLVLMRSHNCTRIVFIDGRTEYLDIDLLPRDLLYSHDQFVFPPLVPDWFHLFPLCMSCVEETQSLIRLEDQYRVRADARKLLHTLLYEFFPAPLCSMISVFLCFPQQPQCIPSSSLRKIFAF